MKISEAKQILEALLFVSDVPLKSDKIAQIMEIDAKTVAILVDELKKEYQSREQSFNIREISGGYQFYTLPEYSSWIKKMFAAQENRLSTASIETLAIIAYKQPITRLEIEEIRGVSVSHTIKKLIDKKVITLAGRKKVPGRPILYRTTPFFLKYFGLKDISEMPQLADFKDLLSSAEDGESGE